VKRLNQQLVLAQIRQFTCSLRISATARFGISKHKPDPKTVRYGFLKSRQRCFKHQGSESVSICPMTILFKSQNQTNGFLQNRKTNVSSKLPPTSTSNSSTNIPNSHPIKDMRKRVQKETLAGSGGWALYDEKARQGDFQAERC
jgi:hypothetical protein